MHVGTQHDPRTDDQYRALAQLGLEHVCADPGGPSAEWTTEQLIRHRERIESFGLALDMIPLCHIGIAPRDEYPNIMLGKSPERDREIERICEVIRSTAEAGIPAVKYYMSYLGVFRTEDRPGRGGSSNSSFVFAELDQNAPLTEAGVVDADTIWERISYFLERVIPVAEEYKVRMACHPHDPGVPSPQGYRGIERVMGSVEGIKRFVENRAQRLSRIELLSGHRVRDAGETGRRDLRRHPLLWQPRQDIQRSLSQHQGGVPGFCGDLPG